MSYYNAFAGHLRGVGRIAYANSYALDYNGIDEFMTLSNPDNFNFGDGVTDSDFSAGAVVNMDDATNFFMFGKGDGVNAEWVFGCGSTDLLTVALFDSTFAAGTRRQRTSSGAQTAFQGTRTLFSFSYISGVITIYRNGSAIAMAAQTSVGYTAMHNTGLETHVGTSQGGSLFANGKIGDSAVWNKGLSAAEHLEWYNGGTPFDLRTHSAAIADPTVLKFFSNIKNQYPTQPDLTGNSAGTMQNMTIANVVAAI